LQVEGEGEEEMKKMIGKEREEDKGLSIGCLKN